MRGPRFGAPSSYLSIAQEPHSIMHDLDTRGDADRTCSEAENQDGSVARMVSNRFRRSNFGRKPTICAASVPCLKTRSIGIDRIPNRLTIPGLSSVLILRNFIRPSYSTARSSRIGLKLRYGPHQGAQNTTETGISLRMTSASNIVSFVSG